MWEPVALPFENDNTPALPTADEIRVCPDILQTRSAATVVGVNDKIVVKFGGGVDVSEGQALVYLERHAPDIPAPRLYAMYYNSCELFLIMERAPGEPLDKIWSSLNDDEKRKVTAKLRHIFDSMRQIECPWPDFFGGLDVGGLHHPIFWPQGAGVDKKYLGPFSGEASFVKAMVGNLRALVEYNKRQDFKVRFYENHLGRVLQNHRPTLTHGDVQKKNIMVVENPRGRDNGGRSFDVVIVDWETAGWYPEYWEYFCASSTFHFVSWDDDWCWYAEQFLQVWPAETALMLMLDKDMGY